jgi:alginate O-acetyltransferase complex protein AlgI
MLHPSMLAAGPLTTLTEFRRARIEKWSIVDYGSGVARCLLGLAKKLVADVFLSRIVAKYVHLTVLHPETANFHVVWPMLFGQMLYIYLDFTGYTDMAIGAGRALGWRIPENFNWPLIRSNLLRFWQSWHMTLSNWVMRRVYFPAFISSRAPIISSTCAMLVIGIWHEPNFGWAAWAIHHGFGLGVTRTFLDVAFRKDRVLALVSNHPLGRFLIGLTGWLLTMSWVALGMSYTLFDNYSLSLQTLRYAFRL